MRQESKEFLQRDERGAFMLIMALILVPVLLFVSLSIDTSRLASTQAQIERVANSMALGALEVFLKSDAAFGDRRVESVTKAADIGNLDANELLSAAGNEISAADFGPGGIATITFGRWFFEEPPQTCEEFTPLPGYSLTCPCDGAKYTGPCLDTNITDVEEVNAVRLDVKTQPTSILSVFNSLVNTGSMELTASSTVAAVPRNGIFLIDLSRSTQFDTHLPFERLNQSMQSQASEFAFRLAPANTTPLPGQTATAAFTCDDWAGLNSAANCANPATQANIAIYCNNRFPGAAPTVIENCEAQCPPIEPFNSHLVWYGSASIQGMQDNAAGPGATQHGRGDYICETLELPDGTQEHYLVEQGVSSNKEPEPLKTILGGVFQALQTLRDQSIAGDTATIIGFDNVVFEPAANSMRRFGPAKIDLSPGSEFSTLEYITNPSTDFDEKIEQFLFPGSGPGRGDTDIAGAIVAARDILLSQSNFNIASNFVVLFSDGVASCYHSNPTNNGCMFDDGDLNGVRCLAPNADNVQLSGYSNGYNVHLLGLKEATQIISRTDGVGAALDPDNRHAVPDVSSGACQGASPREETLFDLGIKFHYFAIGAGSTPFTWSQANKSGDGCASMEELMESDVGLDPLGGQAELFGQFAGILQGINCNNPANPTEQATCNNWGGNYWGDGSNPARNYGQAHQHFLNYGVRPTRGVYAPIRPACEAGENLVADFNTLCANAGANQPVNLGSEYTIQTSDGATRYMLTCDPEGRDPAEQILEKIQGIYGDNPFLVVE